MGIKYNSPWDHFKSTYNYKAPPRDVKGNILNAGKTQRGKSRNTGPINPLMSAD